MFEARGNQNDAPSSVQTKKQEEEGRGAHADRVIEVHYLIRDCCNEVLSELPRYASTVRRVVSQLQRSARRAWWKKRCGGTCCRKSRSSSLAQVVHLVQVDVVTTEPFRSCAQLKDDPLPCPLRLRSRSPDRAEVRL